MNSNRNNINNREYQKPLDYRQYWTDPSATFPQPKGATFPWEIVPSPKSLEIKWSGIE